MIFFNEKKIEKIQIIDFESQKLAIFRSLDLERVLIYQHFFIYEKVLFFTKLSYHQISGSNFPFINILKILECATNRDSLLLATLRYNLRDCIALHCSSLVILGNIEVVIFGAGIGVHVVRLEVYTGLSNPLAFNWWHTIHFYRKSPILSIWICD